MPPFTNTTPCPNLPITTTSFRKLVDENAMAPTWQRRMRLDPTKKLIFRYGPEVDGFRTLRHNHAEVGHLPSPRNCLRKFVRSLIPLSRNPPENYVCTIRWNCRTAVRKSFHKFWFLMGDDSPCRLIPFHPGFSQRSRHYISHRGTKEHACRFSTCTGQPPNGCPKESPDAPSATGS